MNRKFLLLSLLIGVFVSSGVLGYSNPSSNWQANQPTFDKLYAGDYNNYWPILNSMKDGQCNATTDFVIGIPPGGCSPSVVTSDLLEEQNVPVFCELYAIKINPLIKVSSIKSISFKGDYPDGVSSIVYHPARAAVNSYSSLIGDPTLENIGYVVIILKQNKVEANMTEWIAGNLTATMNYDAEEAYGVGRAEFYLESSSDEEWRNDYLASSFWNGKGYLRVTDISDGKAKIQVMSNKDDVLRTLTLKKGETSSSSYLPGFYCKAGLKVKLIDVTAPEDMARLNVGGENIWVRQGGKFLDGKCSVSRLKVRGDNDGEITIRCSGSGTIEPLSLSGVGGVFKVGSNEVKKKLGDKVDGNWYLAYVGKVPGDINNKEVEAAILIEKSEKSDYSEISSSVNKLRTESNNFEEFEKSFFDMVKVVTKGTIREAFIIKKDEENKGIKFLGADSSIKDERTDDKDFKESVRIVKDELVEDYGSEEKEMGGTWAEEALFAEIVLAGQIGNQVTQKDLMDLFLDEYPLASEAVYVRDMRSHMEGVDYSKSFASVYVGDEFKSISVVDFKAVSEGGAEVDLRVDGTNYLEKANGDGVSTGENKVIVKDISPGKVRISFEIEKKGVSDRSFWINEGDSKEYEGVDVYVRAVRVNEVAKISLIPDVEHEKSEADFSFKIGVEKRAIELSPEKAQNMIDNLDKTIEEWEGIVERLGKVVETMKGACFATSAFLTIKNMASGTGGEALARTKVMDYYREKCDNEEEYSRTQCYNTLEGEIEDSVSVMTESLNGVNDDMESCQEEDGVVGDSDGFFGGESVVDNPKYRECLAGRIGVSSVDIDVGEKDPVSVSVDASLSVSQLQSIMLWEKSKVGGDGIGLNSSKVELDSVLRNVALTQVANEKKFSLEDQFKIGDVGFPVDVLVEGRGVFPDGKLRITKSDLEGVINGDLGIEGVKSDEKIGAQIIHSGSRDYLYLFAAGSMAQLGIYEVKKVGHKLNIEGEKLDKIPNLKESISVRVVAPDSCSNSWREGLAQVRYFDIGDNKGLPAVVPFGFPGKDLNDGWYVWVGNSGGGVLSDSMQGYTDSGNVKYFYVCNIGKNRLMESAGGDDNCQSFDSNSKASEFRPCPSIDAGKIYERAREAIRQASSQYGEKSIDIFNQMISVGKPMSAIGGFECQDFMSPSDCKLMFNVCDPVICPPSRCDFGGTFHVDDVIQTGIIGSLVLCLPNYKDGVLIPVCISGVHAGLDTYVSILKSGRDCLQHSIDTGEMIGICDQITSLYICEFWWRQLSPLMDQLIPGILQYATGKGSVRGGGEYAFVPQSWNNMKASISYFKNEYAQNAFRAFDVRSTQDIGSKVCKSFVGTSVPGSANFIDDLLKPESPSQFYAQFSENLFTEATVPSTSQYKVYYHIYAGNDQGVQYKIYLKNPPATSYYSSVPEVSVESGYIAAGESADKSKDFTAPSGYKELCVVINGDEECGFKQVTSSFGLDYLSMKYTEEQASEEDIKSEKECISGTPSALSLVNSNLQAGIGDAVNPEISMSGIVRVCASENPDAGVISEGWVGCNEDKDCANGFKCNNVSKFCESVSEAGVMQKSGSRWKDVGYCGDVNLRCWLDVDSVKDDLRKLEALDGSSISVLDNEKDLIDSLKLDLKGVADLLSLARSDIKALGAGDVDRAKALEIIRRLDNVTGNREMSGAGTNGDRAEALSLKASVYRLLVSREVEKEAPAVITEVRDIIIVDDTNGDDVASWKKIGSAYIYSFDSCDTSSGVTVAAITDVETMVGEGYCPLYKMSVTAVGSNGLYKVERIPIDASGDVSGESVGSFDANSDSYELIGKSKDADVLFEAYGITEEEFVRGFIVYMRLKPDVVEKSCGDCGNGFFDICDSDECYALGSCEFNSWTRDCSEAVGGEVYRLEVSDGIRFVYVKYVGEEWVFSFTDDEDYSVIPEDASMALKGGVDFGEFGNADFEEGLVFIEKSLGTESEGSEVGEGLYLSINAAEMTDYSSEDQWIRTVSAESGSTAYGPVQMTKILAIDYKDNKGIDWTYEERLYLENFINQGCLFLLHGGGRVDLNVLYSGDDRDAYCVNMYEERGINKNTNYESRYDYGGSGDLSSGVDREMYKQVAIKILLSVNDKCDGDLECVWRTWRFGAAGAKSADNQDSRYGKEFANMAVNLELDGSELLA